MEPLQTGLVALVRDFLLVHQGLRALVIAHRSGRLRFEEVQQLVDDSEDSVLFRLKEGCHHLFRSRVGGGDLAMRREALFDLAVGSLFHEAMKFRENLYQKEVYGPKVTTLRDQDQAPAGGESDLLFREFEKILGAAEVRLGEAVQETDALLSLTRAQLRLLLADQDQDGLIARYLVENPELVEAVYPEGLTDLLAEVYGDASQGFAVAALSYLDSAFFLEGRAALGRALLDNPGREDLERLASYSEGMQAFLEGNYAESLERLEAWVDAEPGESERAYATLARAALSKIHPLVGEDPAAHRRADRLVARLERYARVESLEEGTERERPESG